MTDRSADLHPDDAKLVVLARAARLRAYVPHTGVAEGAAVRDEDGRTYSAATVENADPGLTTSALRGAVAVGASSGARSFAAGVLITQGLVSEADLAVLREFGPGVPLHIADPAGRLREVRSV